VLPAADDAETAQVLERVRHAFALAKGRRYGLGGPNATPIRWHPGSFVRQ
jgi:hypothetical protein